MEESVYSVENSGWKTGRAGVKMSRKEVDLFVPGRLCLFGEHTDWAGMYIMAQLSRQKIEVFIMN